MNKSIFCRLFLCLAVLIALFCSVCAAADASADTATAAPADENYIRSVTILESKTLVEVRAHLTDEYVASHGNNPVYLFELLPYQSTSAINDYKPVQMLACYPEVIFNIAFDNTELRSQAKYLVAELNDDGKSYNILTKAKFIGNPEILAKYSDEYPAYTSKKGLANIEVLSDALNTGVSHTVIEIPVNEYLRAAKTDDTYEFTFAGEGYFVDKNLLTALDWKIKYLTDIGANVYLDFVLTGKTAKIESALSCLYFENASPDAEYYALNTRNEQAVRYYTAFVTFMARRYANVKGDYGFAGSFICGKNVNSNRLFHSMGEATVYSFLDMYITQFRITDTALRSVYANGRTYISVSNNLNAASLTVGGKSSDTLDYSASDLLKNFANKIGLGGDIPWRVALNIADTGKAAFWEDVSADDSLSTPYVNLYNISALTSLLSSEELLYKGAARSLAITSFAATSSDGEDAQAAAYAYGWYAAQADDAIESLIYSRQIDSSSEKTGLRSSLFEERKILSLFREIDTSSGKNAASPYLEYLNIKNWDEFFPSLTGKKTEEGRIVLKGSFVSESSIEKEYSSKTALVDFSNGSVQSVTPSDGLEYIEPHVVDTGKTEEYRLFGKVYLPTYAGQEIGVTKTFPLGCKVSDTKYLTINCSAHSVTDQVGLILVLSYGGEYVYRAETKIDSDTETICSFDLTPILDAGYSAFDTLRILFCADKADAISSFTLGNINARAYAPVDSVETILVIAIIAVGVIIIGAIIALVVIRVRSSNSGFVDPSVMEGEARDTSAQENIVFPPSQNPGFRTTVPPPERNHAENRQNSFAPAPSVQTNQVPVQNIPPRRVEPAPEQQTQIRTTAAVPHAARQTVPGTGTPALRHRARRIPPMASGENDQEQSEGNENG